MLSGEIVIRRAWRSQLKPMMIYFILCIASIVLSQQFPGSVVAGRLFTIAETSIYLSLPLFTLLPLAALMGLVVPIYDATFTVDSRGIETRCGILGLRQKITRLRFEDIRGVELHQTLLDRILNIGTVGIGSAASAEIEVVFDGIHAPRELQEMIQAEKDRRSRVKPVTQVSQVASGGL